MGIVSDIRMTVWEGGCLWIGRTHALYAGERHAHHALQLSFRLDGAMTLVADSVTAAAPVMLVDADVRHSIVVDGHAALLFVEPESRAGRSLRSRIGDDAIVELADPAFDAARATLGQLWRNAVTGEPLRAAGRDLLDRLTGAAPAALPDPRVRAMIEAVERCDGPIDLATAASGIYLSPSRLRHLFAEEVGLPFKSYVLWRRLMRSVDALGRGDSLTHAAHHAGFADSPHFSRTFRRTFGLSANMIARL